jgi:sulfur-oxidizing protein SoxB
MSRREFLEVLAVGAAAGLPLAGRAAERATISGIYDLHRFGNNLTLLHFTDCHAQLLPTHYREPDTNLGPGGAAGTPPHLTGQALLKYYNLSPGSRLAHAFTSVDFANAARQFGAVGGFAHLATLVKKVRAQRPGALLLDGGDNWQGSAVSLWTQGRDMIEASRLLGVDAMTGHWEFTYGAERVRQAIREDLQDKIAFVAQNVKSADFGDPVFKPYVIREVNGIPVAVIGQAFPYTPIAHPRHLIPDWTFGIQEAELQKIVDELTAKKVPVIVLLSHNGMDVDLKLASRVTGIDVILGGHTHDAVPDPVVVKNPGGATLVTNAGASGKFLAVLDLDVRGGEVRGYQYRLLPVFASLLEPDRDMQALIRRTRAPHEAKLSERLAVTEGLLYRRGNFNGTFDQLIVEALLQEKNAEIAFSPGFRWGSALLPNQSITLEDVMDQTAITYPAVTVNELTGAQIKDILEDVCDNLFNPDPYQQQGGDMVRTGGLTYACAPAQRMGSRISDLRLAGKPLEAGRRYKVAGWASVAEGAKGEPVWEVVARYLRAKKQVHPLRPNVPALSGG